MKNKYLEIVSERPDSLVKIKIVSSKRHSEILEQIKAENEESKDMSVVDQSEVTDEELKKIWFTYKYCKFELPEFDFRSTIEIQDLINHLNEYLTTKYKGTGHVK